MLVLQETVEAFLSFMALGGPVLWFIFLTLLAMWTLLLERIWYFRMVHPKLMRATVEQWHARSDTTSWYAKRVREQMISEVEQSARAFLGMIKTLIAICPLLGLLGTVYGMVQVFDTMAVTGTGNARAMANGVSQATIPTMAGMVAALSGLLVSARFDTRAARDAEKLGDALQHH
jgi:biopolymer transport protein ExbB